MKYIEILWTSKIGVPSFQTNPFQTRFSEKHARYSNELCLLLMAISHCTRSQDVPRFSAAWFFGSTSCCQHSSTWCVPRGLHSNQAMLFGALDDRWIAIHDTLLPQPSGETVGGDGLETVEIRVVQIELLSRSLTLRVFRSFPQFSNIQKRKHDRSTVLTVAFNDIHQGCLPYPDTRGVNWANKKVNYGKLINFPPCGYHLPPCRLIWINPMDHHGFWGPVNNTKGNGFYNVGKPYL